MADQPPFPDPSLSRNSCGPGSFNTCLEDGTPVCIRRVTSADEGLIRAGIERMSPQSRYLRFFSGMRTPPDWVIKRLLDVDGVDHIAWGAIALDEPGGPAIGAVHAFRDAEGPDSAEFSVAILDEWHGLGLGKLLTATILLDAQAEGIACFQMETLAENRRVIAFSGLLGGKRKSADGLTNTYVIEVEEALNRLRKAGDPPGIAAVFAAFDR